MKPDKAPGLAILIGKRLDKRDNGEDRDEPDEMEDDKPEKGDAAKEMQSSAMADFIAALQRKSVPEAVAALKDFLQLCDQEEEPEEDEEEPEEEHQEE